MTAGLPRERLFTRQVITLLGAGVAYFVVAGISFPVLPRLVEQRLDGGNAEIGYVFGIMAGGMLLMRPFVGYLADRFGRRPLMVVGAIAVGVLQFLHVPAAEVGLPALLAVRFLVGMASSAMYLGQATTATEIPPVSRSGEVFSTFSVSVFVGFAIGPVLGETVLQSSGFTATFAVAAGFAFLCALLGVLLPETRPSDVVARLDGFGSLFHPVAARAGAVSFLMFTAFIGFNAFVTPYGESLGLERVRWVLLAYSLTTLVTRAFGGRFIDRGNRLWLGTAAHLTVVLGLGIIVVFDAVWSLYLGATVMAAGLSFNVPLMVVVAADSARPQDRSKVVATVIVFGDLANSLGALGLGVVADAAGYRAMFATVMVSAGLAALLYRSPFMAPVTGIRRQPAAAPAKAEEAAGSRSLANPGP